MTVTSGSATIAQRPVSRGAAIVRGLLWGSLAFLLGTASWFVLSTLNFSPTGMSGNLVDISIAIIMLPVALLTLYLALLTVRWIGLGIWPGAIGVFATDDELVLRLGPFGTTRYDAARLDIRYPFELSGDEEDGGFEAFLPEEQQRARLLPRIAHPGSKESINLIVLKFAGGPEPEITTALRPAFDRWRSDTSESNG